MKQALVFLIILPLVASHSWVHCMDYDTSAPNDVNYYNAAKCTGFGRGWSTNCERTNNQFGLDCGYNHQNPNQVCPFRLNPSNYGSMYSQASPMSTYAPGERVCLAWPAKNHVAASCANPFIPDSGTKIFMSGPNPTADPNNVQDMQNNFRVVADLGRNPRADALQGFQNCPKFCENNDKCLCTGCFNIPNDVQAGAVYSFFWAWSFNSPTDTYTTCWEARIAGNGQTPPTQTPASSTRAATSATRAPTTAPTPSTNAPPTNNCNNPTAQGNGNGLVGQYFKGTNFNQFVTTRTDAKIAFDFGFGAPANSGLDVNFWTIRWLGLVEPRFSGQWTFYTISDDGCRLWVRGQMLINDFTGHGRLQKSGQITLTAGQRVGLKLEYLEIDQSASINLQWSHQCVGQQDIPTSQMYANTAIGFDSKCTMYQGTGKGLTARYFNPNTTTAAVTQVEGPNDNRDEVVPKDIQPFYKVEWSGFILPSFDETYSFFVSSARGVRLTVNNVTVIENIVPHTLTEDMGNVTLTPGSAVPIFLEYWSNGQGADNNVVLRWSTPECLGNEMIPKNDLYTTLDEIPTTGDVDLGTQESSAVTLFSMLFVIVLLF